MAWPMRCAGQVYVGTSGPHYEHWTGTFYSPNQLAGDWPGFYVNRLRTLEISNTFCQLPEEEKLRGA